MRHLHFGKLFFVVFSLLLAYTVSARKPIKTLLITGQNNHNWQVSHVVLKQILENSGRFDVDFVISPEQGKDMSGFVLDFSPYQLVVLDYNGDSWPEETNRRFLEYVQNGGGVVIYHAADNALSKWPEFNRICALGGWEGRNENSGPYVYWKDGKLVKDSSAGPGGFDYGNARIFHTMLGHAGATTEDNIAMQCTGFQVLLLRGAEWAATGKVTQKVPKDFPTETTCSYRKDYKEN